MTTVFLIMSLLAIPSLVLFYYANIHENETLGFPAALYVFTIGNLGEGKITANEIPFGGAMKIECAKGQTIGSLSV